MHNHDRLLRRFVQMEIRPYRTRHTDLTSGGIELRDGEELEVGLTDDEDVLADYLCGEDVVGLWCFGSLVWRGLDWRGRVGSGRSGLVGKEGGMWHGVCGKRSGGRGPGWEWMNGDGHEMNDTSERKRQTTRTGKRLSNFTILIDKKERY